MSVLQEIADQIERDMQRPLMRKTVKHKKKNAEKEGLDSTLFAKWHAQDISAVNPKILEEIFNQIEEDRRSPAGILAKKIVINFLSGAEHL